MLMAVMASYEIVSRIPVERVSVLCWTSRRVVALRQAAVKPVR
jgi:hypothetical protein